MLNYVGNVGLKVSGKKAAMPFARWFHEIFTVLLLPLTLRSQRGRMNASATFKANER